MPEVSSLHRELFAVSRTRTKEDYPLSAALENVANLAYENKPVDLKNALILAVNEFPSVRDNADKIVEIIGSNLVSVPEIKDALDLFQKECKLLEHLAQQQQQQIKAELEELKKSGNVTKASQSDIRDLYRDKGMAVQTGFAAKDKKSAGVSAGYIASEKDSGNTFILKQFYKSTSKKYTRQDILNRRDGVNEFIFGGLYNLAIPSRSPKEQLVTPDVNVIKNVNARSKRSNTSKEEIEKQKNTQDQSIYVRSKFFSDATTLDNFSGSDQNTLLNINNSNLLKLNGFEKVIASCQLLGEVDYHAGNLMVQSGKNASGKPTYEVMKIDHGRSGMKFSSNIGVLINNMNHSFNLFGYNKAISQGNLRFSAKEFSDSLNQMTQSISRDQISTIVDQKIADLKTAGFDPNEIQMCSNFSGKSQFWQVHNINSFDDLSNHYKNTLNRNLENMKQIGKGLEVIGKFSNTNPEFQNGNWIAMMDASPVKDPVLYAAYNNIEIEGKNALEWARDNDYKVIDRQVKNGIVERSVYKDPLTEMLDLKSKSKLPLSYSEVTYIQKLYDNKEIQKGSSVDTKLNSMGYNFNNIKVPTKIPEAQIGSMLKRSPNLTDNKLTSQKQSNKAVEQEANKPKLTIGIDKKSKKITSFATEGQSLDTAKLNDLLKANKVSTKSFVKNISKLGKENKLINLKADQIVEKSLQTIKKNKSVGLEQFLGRKPQEVEKAKPKGLNKLFAKLKGLGKVKKADGIQAPGNLPNEVKSKTNSRKM
ncbi:MAG: hypothetical protein J0G32_06480 [Alphaproteobacteria bacterium]|nr:hypothetical protein [Alphaproteobacteria bacterium]